MFRFQDNVPEIYINESRDFQILSRLSDTLFSGVKYDVDSIVNIIDAMSIKDRMLDLLCTKVGFFPRVEIDNQVLKYILASFPYIIKNKGTKLGIEAAINAILKAESNPDATKSPQIDVNKIDNEGKKLYLISIYPAIQIYNTIALKEVLRYVIPAGYSYKVLPYRSILSSKDTPDIISQSDIINAIKVNPVYNASLKASTSVSLPGFSNSMFNAFDTMEIATPNSTNTISNAFFDNVTISTSKTSIIANEDPETIMADQIIANNTIAVEDE